MPNGMTFILQPGDFVYHIETMVIGVLCDITQVYGTGEINAKVKFLGDSQGIIMTGEYKECLLSHLRQLSDEYVRFYVLSGRGLIFAGYTNNGEVKKDK